MIQNSRPVVAFIRAIDYLSSYPSIRADRKLRAAEHAAEVEYLSALIAERKAALLRRAALTNARGGVR